VRLSAIRHRLSGEGGQAAVEFALVLPLVLFVLFLIVEFGRVFNVYNDLNQMAADGARFAAVNNYLTDTQYHAMGDTTAAQTATIVVCTPTGTSAIGDTVRVKVSTPITVIPFLKIAGFTLAGTAEMRIEQAPATPLPICS
jgi:Flp pilus assembly protein TadG